MKQSFVNWQCFLFPNFVHASLSQLYFWILIPWIKQCDTCFLIVFFWNNALFPFYKAIFWNTLWSRAVALGLLVLSCFIFFILFFCCFPTAIVFSIINLWYSFWLTSIKFIIKLSNRCWARNNGILRHHKAFPYSA